MRSLLTLSLGTFVIISHCEMASQSINDAGPRNPRTLPSSNSAGTGSSGLLPPDIQTQKSGRRQSTPVPGHQYSDGRRRVVMLRSASVMIQILAPVERV